jgi:hypothetical protein
VVLRPELLVTAQRIGLRIHEVPVDWVDDIDSRVDIVATAVGDVRGVIRMVGPSARQRALLRPARPNRPGVEPTTVRARPPRPSAEQPPPPQWAAPPRTPDRFPPAGRRPGAGTRQPVFADELLRFAGVGAVSTVAHAGLFAVLEPGLGCYRANTVAIGLCSLGNTWAHRGLADTARLGLDPPRRVLTAGALLGVSLAASTGALTMTRAVGLRSLGPELCAVVVANLGAAVIRFGILRSWIFRPEFGTHLSGGQVPEPSGGHAPERSGDPTPGTGRDGLRGSAATRMSE